MSDINYKKAGSYYVIGTIINKGIVFFTLPIFTRLLSTYDYGLVNTYNSWVSILSMVMAFALHASIRIAYIDYRDKFEDYTSTIITFTLIVIAVCTGGALIFSVFVPISMGMLVVFLCIIQSGAMAIITDYNYYLMMKRSYRARTALLILPNLIAVVLSVLTIRYLMTERLYLGRVIPTALVKIVFSIVIVILVYRKSRCFFKSEYIKYGLKISTPLIAHGVALSVLSQSDRMMITWFAGASQTGIYSVIYNFSMIATALTSSLEGIWMPWFLDRMKGRMLDDIRRIAKDYVNLMTYILAALILISPEVIKMLTERSYWVGISIVPPIVLANFIIFIYTLYVDVEHYYKKTPFITVNTIIAATLNIVLNILFVPRYGYVAAAYTTLVSYIVSLLLHARYANQLEPGLYRLKPFARSFVHLLSITIIFYVSVDWWVVRWGVMILYIIAMFIRERKEIAYLLPGLSLKR